VHWVPLPKSTTVSKMILLLNDKFVLIFFPGVLTAEVFQVDFALAKYWCEKVFNLNFRAFNGWGGNKGTKFSTLKMHEVSTVVWNTINSQNQVTLQEIVSVVRNNGFGVTRMWVSRLLKKWRWSFKIPAVTQREKYALSNLEYYVDFCSWLSNVDLKRVKFVDELHFDSRSK
jgi:hypothetical protein